jgi:hypothetical protein
LKIENLSPNRLMNVAKWAMVDSSTSPPPSIGKHNQSKSKGSFWSGKRIDEFNRIAGPYMQNKGYKLKNTQ